MVPSHQAPVLPLKRWRPTWFSGLGLVLGTMAPDLPFILGLDVTGFPPGHTLLGQVYVTVPMVLVLHWLATVLVLPWLLPHLPGGPPLHLHALARSRPFREPLAVVRVAYSGLLGGLTHVTIDAFTHGDAESWGVALLPVLRTPVPHPGGPAPLYDALQLWLTVVLGALALQGWSRMGAAVPAAHAGASAVWKVRAAPAAACAGVCLGLVAAALLGALTAPLLRHSAGSADAPKLAAYGAITFSALAAVMGAVASRARRALARVMLEVGEAFEA
jgi:hypothetical protein